MYRQFFDAPFDASAGPEPTRARLVGFTVVGLSADPSELAGWLWGIYDTWGRASVVSWEGSGRTNESLPVEPLYILLTDKGKDSPLLRAGFLPPFLRDQVSRT